MKKYIILSFLVCIVVLGFSQNQSFSVQFTPTVATNTGANLYRITGNIVDVSGILNASNVQIGDSLHMEQEGVIYPLVLTTKHSASGIVLDATFMSVVQLVSNSPSQTVEGVCNLARTNGKGYVAVAANLPNPLHDLIENRFKNQIKSGGATVEENGVATGSAGTVEMFNFLSNDGLLQVTQTGNKATISTPPQFAAYPQVSPANGSTFTSSFIDIYSTYRQIAAPAAFTLDFNDARIGSLHHLVITPTGVSTAVTFATNKFLEGGAALTTKTFNTYTVLTVRCLSATIVDVISILQPALVTPPTMSFEAIQGNGADISYLKLTGTPVVTFSKSGGVGTVSVTGGTVKWEKIQVDLNTATDVDASGNFSLIVNGLRANTLLEYPLAVFIDTKGGQTPNVVAHTYRNQGSAPVMSVTAGAAGSSITLKSVSTLASVGSTVSLIAKF